MPLLNTAGNLYVGNTPVQKVYRGSTQIWTPPAASTTPLRLAQYQGATASSHVVPLSPASTPGTELVVVAHAPAVITMGGWVLDTIYLGDTHMIVARLSAAAHTSSLTSLTVGLSGARRLSLVAIQAPSLSSFYRSLTWGAPSGSTWYTNAHTMKRKHQFATYIAGSDASTVFNQSLTSLNNGFTAFADTGPSPALAESNRIVMGYGSDVNLVSAGVTATFNANVALTLAHTGFVAWDEAGSGTVLRAQYQSPSSTSHVIPINATIPGRDLLVIAHSESSITFPSPWTQGEYNGSSSSVVVGRLSAANHTASLTSITVTTGVARVLSAVVIEDDMTSSYTELHQQGPVSGDTLWGTGLHNVNKTVELAVFTGGSTGAIAGTVGSYDHGFASFADTGTTSASGTRILVGLGADVNFVNDGVVLTMASALTNLYVPTTYSGMIAWNRS